MTNTEYPEASTKCGEKPSEHTIYTANSNNEAETMVSVASNVSELHATDVDQVSCSLVKKRAKHFDAERIIMGEELTDLEINFAQQLLKEQFKHINGLHSTLLQEKRLHSQKLWLRIDST